MDTSTIGLLYGGITLLLLFSGMPIAFALGLSALGFIVVFMPAPMIHSVAETIYSELDNFTLLTIPLFVLMGAAIGKTRAGSDVYNSLNAWMYRVPGGLGLANVFACAVFAAMCGSSPATCSAIGSSGIPQLVKRGYSEGLATGLIAAGGTLGILIPPSITLILYGLASEQIHRATVHGRHRAGRTAGLAVRLLGHVQVQHGTQVRLRCGRQSQARNHGR